MDHGIHKVTGDALHFLTQRVVEGMKLTYGGNCVHKYGVWKYVCNKIIAPRRNIQYFFF